METKENTIGQVEKPYEPVVLFFVVVILLMNDYLISAHQDR